MEQSTLCCIPEFEFFYGSFFFVGIFHGSPVYNLIIRYLGTKFKGQAILFPSDYLSLYTKQLWTYQMSPIIMQFIMTSTLVIAKWLELCIQVSSYASNTSLVRSEENGPLRSFVGTYGKMQSSDALRDIEDSC